ncbi:hypothetical protein SAMN06265218_101365 [Fodinibius sediminis]|uniref:Uncharacterized protein n=2 Tax=Fodinibius sediminis TaxID=1214077 RepID=A0A521ATT3_9BACT|nr:hypothetical protein SAMN06265218_101365 [Fodinibius sediminis]
MSNKKEEPKIDALALKRKLSHQFSKKYSTKEGLIDRKKLKKDLKKMKKDNI